MKKSRVKRIYHCTRAALLSAAGKIQSALADTTFGPPVTARLTTGFALNFGNQLTAAGGGGVTKAGQAGNTATLTKEQQADYLEMGRLTSAARRTAALAFPGNSVLLHTEFEVGQGEEDQSLQAEIDRAQVILASCQKYAAQLGTEGWIAADTTALENAIGGLGGVDLTQEASKDSGLDITDERTTNENQLYTMCLRAQNAARLQYPSTKSSPGNATARARYLINEFPPPEPPRHGADDAQSETASGEQAPAESPKTEAKPDEPPANPPKA